MRAPRPCGARRSSGGSLVEQLADAVPGAGARFDVDAARLHRLRDLTLELDGEQPVSQPRPDHLHMLGKLEAALERAGRDAAVEILAFRLSRSLAADREPVGLRGNIEIFLPEACNGHGDPVLVVRKLDRVERRIIVSGLAA